MWMQNTQWIDVDTEQNKDSNVFLVVSRERGFCEDTGMMYVGLVLFWNSAM